MDCLSGVGLITRAVIDYRFDVKRRTNLHSTRRIQSSRKIKRIAARIRYLSLVQLKCTYLEVGRMVVRANRVRELQNSMRWIASIIISGCPVAKEDTWNSRRSVDAIRLTKRY